MRTVVLCSLLLVAGCLKYRIRIETVVGADGGARRTLTLRETEEKHTWARFLPPAEPYTVEGSEEEGFAARANLQAGRHPSGLRVLLRDYEGEYEGARRALPCAEGIVAVETTDVIVGTLYRYQETIALGTDAVRFRAGLREWLDLGLKVWMKALRLRLPDVEFDAVEAHAREKVVPQLEQSLLILHLAVTGLVDDLARAQLGLGADPEAMLASPGADVVLHELAAWGIRLRTEDVKTAKSIFDEQLWEFDEEAVLREFLSPLPAAQRERVRQACLNPDDEMEEVWQAAWQSIGEDPDQVTAKLMEFLTSGVGAYAVYGFLDSFEIEASVAMPGRVLQTNGEVTALPRVTWRVTDEELILARPQLFAYSFVPAKGFSEGAWTFRQLQGAAAALANVPAEQREALRKFVPEAQAAGWPEEAPDELGDAAMAYALLRPR